METQAENQVLQKPRIKRYSNLNQYIKDVFSYYKNANPKFTLDQWSLEMGFKSRSFMFMVYQGKRQITSKFIETFSQIEKLCDSEKNHMLLLAHYQKAKTVPEKSIYLGRIYENLEDDESVLDLKNYSKFLATLAYPLIKLVLSFDDVEATESTLAELLNLEVSSVKDHLIELEKMDLIVSNSTNANNEKIWKAKTKAFVVPDSRTDQAIDLYHLRTTEEAAQIVQSDIADKRFRSVFFSISEDKHPELLEDIELFMSKIRNKYGNQELTNKKVMKLNLQAYPVTEVYKK